MIGSTSNLQATNGTRSITHKELSKHASEDDCWVALDGVVYDMTSFVNEHPGGRKAVLDLAGQDGTAAFLAVHGAEMHDDFQDLIVGELAN